MIITILFKENNMPKLSICVATIPERKHKIIPLLEELEKQVSKYNNDVEILYLGDFKTMTISEKRNHLVNMAKGTYITFVDDDDQVCSDYIDEIYNAIVNNHENPDIIVFDVLITDGTCSSIVLYDINFADNYNMKNRFIRLPNHLMAIKKSIYENIPKFEGTWYEDFKLAADLKKIVKSQVRISKILYKYQTGYSIKFIENFEDDNVELLKLLISKNDEVFYRGVEMLNSMKYVVSNGMRYLVN